MPFIFFHLSQLKVAIQGTPVAFARRTERYLDKVRARGSKENVFAGAAAALGAAMCHSIPGS